MKAAPFELHRPTSVAEAVDLLRTLGDDAKPLAGGQSLVAVLALRLGRFDHLVDLNGIDDLRYVRLDGDHLEIGAMTRQADVLTDPLVTAHAPLLARATRLVGHFQIRNRGTIGGSIAHCDGAAEFPAAVLALDADLVLTGPTGTRSVAAAGFFRSAFTTALEGDELLTAVRVRVAPPRSGFAVEEMARRRGDFAVAGAMCAVTLDEDARVRTAAVSLFGVGSVPVRAPAAETALVGSAAVEVDPAHVAALAVEGLEPVGDVHGSTRYRRSVAGVMTRTAVGRALEEAARA